MSYISSASILLGSLPSCREIDIPICLQSGCHKRLFGRQSSKFLSLLLRCLWIRVEAVVAGCKGIVLGVRQLTFKASVRGTSKSEAGLALLAVRLILHFMFKKSLHIYIQKKKKIFRDSDPVVFTDNTSADSNPSIVKYKP